MLSALGHLLAYLVDGSWNVPSTLPFVGCILLRLAVIESSVGGRYPSLTLRIGDWCFVRGSFLCYLCLFVASVFGIFIRAFRAFRGQTIFIPLRQFQSSLAVTIFIESGAW